MLLDLPQRVRGHKAVSSNFFNRLDRMNLRTAIRYAVKRQRALKPLCNTRSRNAEADVRPELQCAKSGLCSATRTSSYSSFCAMTSANDITV
jgi:hypothetical protein